MTRHNPNRAHIRALHALSARVLHPAEAKVDRLKNQVRQATLSSSYVQDERAMIGYRCARGVTETPLCAPPPTSAHSGEAQSNCSGAQRDKAAAWGMALGRGPQRGLARARIRRMGLAPRCSSWAPR